MDYTYKFTSSKSPEEITNHLKQIDQWWSGLYNETIDGTSELLNDEFTFRAGGGAHYSKQKLVELIPGKRVVWQVTDSTLSFLHDKSEWTDTKLVFDMVQTGSGTEITFTHEGLVPEIECYDSCSGAWTQYLENLQDKLQ